MSEQKNRNLWSTFSFLEHKWLAEKDKVFEKTAWICSFFMGASLSKAYLPLLFISFLLFIKDANLSQIKSIFFHSNRYFLYIALFFILTFALGALNQRLTIGLKTFLTTFGRVMATAFLIHLLQTERQRVYLLMSYIAGLTFVISITYLTSVYFNFNEGTKLYGYGRVYHPIYGLVINTPGYSSLLSLCTLVAIFIYYESTEKRLSITALTLALFCHSQSYFYAGRAYYILLIIGLGGIFIVDQKLKNKNFYISIFSLLSIAFLQKILLNFSGIGQESAIARGIGSLRFEHWVDGFFKIWKYPLGGFTVNLGIEKTFWFHNLWIDTARVAGWAPLACLLVLNLYIFLKTINYKKPIRPYLLILQIVCLAQMFQDVVIEGFPSALIIYFAIGAIVCSPQKILKTTCSV